MLHGRTAERNFRTCWRGARRGISHVSSFSRSNISKSPARRSQTLFRKRRAREQLLDEPSLPKFGPPTPRRTPVTSAASQLRRSAVSSGKTRRLVDVFDFPKTVLSPRLSVIFGVFFGVIFFWDPWRSPSGPKASQLRRHKQKSHYLWHPLHQQRASGHGLHDCATVRELTV